MASGIAVGQTETGSLVCKSVTQRTSDQGCYILVNNTLGTLPQQGALFWHIDKFPDRRAAEAQKDAFGTVLEAYGSVWLITIATSEWKASGD
jgi:hypothetical protein